MYNSRGSRSKSFFCVQLPWQKLIYRFEYVLDFLFPCKAFMHMLLDFKPGIEFKSYKSCPISKRFQGANAMLFLKCCVLRTHIWQPGEIRQIQRSLVLLCNEWYSGSHQDPSVVYDPGTRLQLSFWRRQCWSEEISNISCRLVQIEAHSLASKTFWHNVELNTRLMLVPKNLIGIGLG